MSHEHHHDHFGLKLGFKIAKLMVSVASVAAACFMVKEIHKVHKAIEKREHKKLL